MKKVVIFGAGALGKSLRYRFGQSASVIMVDNDSAKWSDEIFSPEKLKEIDFDFVYIAVSSFIDEIHEQLKNELCVPEHKIIKFWEQNNNNTLNFLNRVSWLEPFSMHLNIHNISGSIAEVGVLQGDFSQHLNRLFPDRRLYLFDTFEGYDTRDFTEEQIKNEVADIFQNSSDFLPETSVELVMSKLPYPDKAIIKKGYFPETFDITDEKFCFVFLDLNLYNPTKSGLEIFYPLMSRGGVILIHDYFFGGQNGVSRAVDEFLNENSIFAVPAGDNTAVAIIKN
ncbi:MAG: TylF/MycF family methyltransferase [Oscillospiraceae bacterium]|nr:TylF/MycF family methyltransferase [Oscillospiraceae bacterium]